MVWRWLKRGGLVVLAAWGCWYVVTSWRLAPAAVHAGGELWPAPAEVAELMHAVQAVPLFEGAGEPDPGMQAGWAGATPATGTALAALLAGELLEERPLVEEASEYLSEPAVQGALERVVALETEAAAWADRRVATETLLAGVDVAAIVAANRETREEPDYYNRAADLGPLDHLNQAVLALTARARLRRERDGDYAGALADLKAALRIARFQSAHEVAIRNRLAASWWGYGLQVTRWPMAELTLWLQDVRLTADEAAALTAFLRAALPPSFSAAAFERLHWSKDIEWWLDRYYTRGGDGDGWLVVSHALPESSMGREIALEGLSGFWNVFTPLFFTRDEMRRRLLWRQERVASFDALVPVAWEGEPWRFQYEAMRVGDSLPLAAGIDEHRNWLDLNHVVLVPAYARAWRVMVALAHYRQLEGAYPVTLDVLVPDYLEMVPRDLVTGERMGYELTEDGYRLGPLVEVPVLTYQGWDHRLPMPNGEGFSYTLQRQDVERPRAFGTGP